MIERQYGAPVSGADAGIAARQEAYGDAEDEAAGRADSDE
jgi:hypothetical protein